MDVGALCTFKMKIESKKWEYEGIKDQCPYQIKIKMRTPSQEPPVSSKTPNEDLKDMDVL